MNYEDLFSQIKSVAGDVDTSFEEKGKVGGTGNKFKIEEDGVYDVVIDNCVFKQSQSTKSCWYEVSFKTEDGAKLSTKMFVLNSDGLYYTIDKNGNKKSILGWRKMASLHYLLDGQWDGLPVPETMDIAVYDYDSKSEVLKSMPVVKKFLGKPLTITVKMQLEDGYPDASTSRLVPNIRNFLDPITKKSSTEKRNSSEPQVIKDFEESIKNSPEPIDKRVKSKNESKVDNTPFNVTEPSGFSFS